jgi:serine/threonine protein kinase
MVSDKITDVKYAVKAFSKGNLESSKTGKPALVNEINIMRMIESDYSVKLEAVYETKNSVYLVLELLEGGEIFKIDNGKLVQSHAKYILYHLLKSLRDLRKKNIIHRDLKPDNIILKEADCSILDNQIKLVDFGLSAISLQDTYLIHRKCGTPGFIAPEVINMAKTDTADMCENCDIFSVGMIFFFMLTGIIPYDGEDIYEIMKNNKKATINFDIPELKKFSPDCIELLKLMLALKPEERITPTEAIKHDYFNDYQKYKTALSMTIDDDYTTDDTNGLEVADEKGEFESINLAANLEKIKNRYQPTPSFRLKNSIHFNPNPELQNGTDTFNEINSNYSGSPDHRSDSRSQVSGGSRMTKDFIIRMTPLQRNRKANLGQKKEFYRNVLLKNTLQGKTDKTDATSTSSKKNTFSAYSNDLGQSVFSTGNSDGHSSGMDSPTQSPNSTGSHTSDRKSSSAIKTMKLKASTFNYQKDDNHTVSDDSVTSKEQTITKSRFAGN